MRFACAIVLAACVTPPEPQVAYPTLEAETRQPIDPYGDDPTAHGVILDYVPSDIDLGDPGAVATMVLRVETGSYRLPSSPNHRVVANGKIQRVTIRRGPGAQVARHDRDEALRATATIDAANPAIRRAASEATSGARTDHAKVVALVTWIYTHITYVHAQETIASVVLARGSGDCSEMSLLFLALARAAGIPARPVIGLAATRVDGASGFGFHAWAEVALEGHWVPVDPTWNEPLADATHLVLSEGDGDAWVAAVDNLAIAVESFERDPRLEGHADARRLARELPTFMRVRAR